MAAERAPREGLRAIPEPPASDPHAGVRAAIRWGVLGLVLWAPLPFGSVEPWTVLVMEFGAFVLAGCAAFVAIRDPEPFSRRGRAGIVAALALVLLGLAQATPLPFGIAEIVAPRAAEAGAALAATLGEPAPRLATLSLSPADSIDASMRLLAYVALGFATAIAFRRRRHFVTAGVVVVAGALFQALYGAGEFLSGRQMIFGYAKKYYLDSATGTFINRNHFASCLAMALPFALALGFARRRRRIDPAKKLVARAAALVLAAALVIGIALSGSRGGSAAALVGLAAWAFTAGTSRLRMILPVAVLVLPIGFLLWQDVRLPTDRLAAFEADLASPTGRAAAWRASLAMLPMAPVAGWGMGAFEESFAGYGGLGGATRYDHLHNEWLQTAIETGVVGLGIAALLAGILLVRTAPIGHPGMTAAVTAAAWSACIVAVVHGVVDFAPRIPGIASQIAFAAGLVVAGQSDPIGG